MCVCVCAYSGAVNVNFTGMMKKRFMSGKIGLYDLVPTEEGREKFKVSKGVNDNEVIDGEVGLISVVLAVKLS